ncbi:protein of unknown function [Streptantibioticus cattleyicolor NRRL 8057 = DSM 46488]|nr:protein of unknown function [Streptantibioticus cattleyicolor NRRL 8057 = DSM 46488]
MVLPDVGGTPCTVVPGGGLLRTALAPATDDPPVRRFLPDGRTDLTDPVLLSLSTSEC